MKKIGFVIGRRSVFAVFAVIMTMLALAGCQKAAISFDDKKSESEKELEAKQQAAIDKNKPLDGTIGEATYLEGRRSMFVQGYGLVVGLPGTGSNQCPQALRKDLMSTIATYQRLYGEHGRKQGGNAGIIIDSKDTAVVKVSGYIPFGSLKDESFDLMVEAIPGTGTISLEGGRLYTTDLRVYAGGYGGGSNSSRILARGAGAIFINPFDVQAKQGALKLKRKGYVLNGGENAEDRKLHLILYQPSYGMSRAIEQRINSVFGPPSDDPLWQSARAKGPDRIELHVPRKFRGQLGHYLDLVQNLYIRTDPAYVQTKANELASSICEPNSNAIATSFAWEAMGRAILPLIQPLYASDNDRAAFYAARAGARLGDSVAMEKLSVYAMNPKSPYRSRAIKTLGYCRNVLARRTLRKILDDEAIDMRILAYEGLSRFEDGVISRRFIGADNLILDVVRSNFFPMVYVTRANQPKIVLFGNLKLETPIFYSHPDNSITITARADDDRLALIRRTPAGKSSGRIEVGLNLASLIGFLGNDATVFQKNKVSGLALPYSHIVSILNALCKDGSISARFKMQELTEITELEDDIVGRPEKE